jgi:hypothetical protein
MENKIMFTSHIFEQITKTIASLHTLLSDITSRSDLMAQELNEQQDRIEKLEKIISENLK